MCPPPPLVFGAQKKPGLDRVKVNGPLMPSNVNSRTLKNIQRNHTPGSELPPELPADSGC